MVAISKRDNRDFNFDWKFAKGEFTSANAPDFDDALWQDIRLPHDWSVEASFTQENATGCTAFLPGGVGWYRKTFAITREARGRVTWIEFDGVYKNCDVWLNGQHLGYHPSATCTCRGRCPINRARSRQWE